MLKTFLLFLFFSIYLGFYFPDPYYYENPNALGLRLFLYAIRSAGALLLVCLLLMWWLVSKTRDKKYLWSIVCGSTLASLFLTVSFVAIFDSLRGHPLTQYHSFLQKQPPVVKFDPSIDLKIAFLGGSTTEWGDSNKYDWPKRVEKILNLRREQTVSTVNVGKEWYSSQHTLLNYLSNVRQLKPDVIVVMHSINDLLYNADFSYLSVGSFRSDYGHFAGYQGEWLHRRGILGNVLSKCGAAWYHKPRVVIESSTFIGISSFVENLKLLIRNARADGARVVLMTEPTILSPTSTNDSAFYMVNFEAVGPAAQWSTQTAAEGMRQYNNAVRELARTAGVGLIDLESKIPKTKEYFTDEVHFKDNAFDLVAKEVAKGLQSEFDVRTRVYRKK